MQQFCQVERRGLFQSGIVAKEFQAGVNHGLHLVDVAKKPLLLLEVFDEFAAQAHAGQGVRRSWEMAASIWVRSLMKCCN